MGILDFYKSLTPIDEEAETQAAAQQAIVAPPVQAPQVAPTIEEQGISEIDIASRLAPIYEQRAPIRLSRVKVPEANDEDSKARELKFKTDLKELREGYNTNRAATSKRQMYAEMMAALGNNIGTMVAGAQAMNTKASVNPAKTAPINVKDMVAAVDKRFDGDYGNLLKQYKSLKDGGITAKERLYADIHNSNIEAREAGLNANLQVTDRNALTRGVGMELKDQKDNELSDKQTEEMTDIVNTLGEVKKLHAQADNYKDKLGPVSSTFEDSKSGLFGGMVRPFSPIDKGWEKFRADTKAVQAGYRKLITGLTASEPERLELANMIPDPSAPYEAYKSRAEAFEERIERLLEDKKKALGKFQGKNVAGYAQPKTAATVRIQGPSGQVATVSAAAAEKYLSQPGYKKVD